ncbi:MAG: glycosyl hydrolase family 18 protein, partial [Thermoactinomyces sp.]
MEKSNFSRVEAVSKAFKRKKVTLIGNAVAALVLVGGSILFTSGCNQEAAAPAPKVNSAKVQPDTINNDASASSTDVADVTEVTDIKPLPKKESQYVENILTHHNIQHGKPALENGPSVSHTGAPTGGESGSDHADHTATTHHDVNSVSPAPGKTQSPAPKMDNSNQNSSQPAPNTKPATATNTKPATAANTKPAPAPTNDQNQAKPSTKPVQKPQQPSTGQNQPSNGSTNTQPTNGGQAAKPAVPSQPTSSMPVQKYHGIETTAWFPFWSTNSGNKVLSSQSLDSINLFMYELQANGDVGYMQYAKGPDQNTLALAHKKGTKIYATVANTDGWNDVNKAEDELHNLINTPAKRSQLADKLLAFTLKNKFDGVDLDLEVIRGNDRDNFSAFVEVLAQKMHQKNKKVLVSVYPKTSYGNWDGPISQDWERLGKAADEVVIMTYNYSMNSPGPGAPLDWVRKIVNYANTQVPSQKIYFGLPSYGYLWTSDGKRSSLSYSQAQNLIKTHHAKVVRDQNGEPSFTYTDNGVTYTGYYQDSISWKQKINTIKQGNPHIGGITEWYIGAEDPATWNMLKTELK